MLFLVSFLVLLIYFSIFNAVLFTDHLSKIPTNHNPILNITQALSDLQHLTAYGPHPYNSHSNDLARTYILSRLQPIAAAHPEHVHIADDNVSNGSWVNGGGTTGVYFEGTNVLVKIDGLEDGGRENGGVLFSAHYDSVSTAPGATDDGMAVATVLQLVQLLSENRGKRTAVFNINNGEENFLNGAHAFLQHPWSNITDTFLNLEGAASGGRPLLFRTSSLPPLRSFLPNHVPHPHANVLSADAFARGAIRSDTDYSIYTGLHARFNTNASQPRPKVMQGLDYAFYKHRSRYHTKYDAVPYTEGGKRALWSMLEGVAGAGRALVDVPFTPAVDLNIKKGTGAAAGVVYFDLFASTLIIFPIFVLRTFNIVFLAVVPVVVVLLSLCLRLVRERRSTSTATIRQQHERQYHGIWDRIKKIHWTPTWLRFWGAFLLSVGAQAGLVVTYAKLNPYIVHSAPYLVLVTSFTLAYLTIALPLFFTTPKPPNDTSNPTAKKHHLPILTHLLILSYLLLLLSTIFLPEDMGGTYPLSAYVGCVFLGWLVGWMEVLVGAWGRGEGSEEVDGDGEREGGEGEVQGGEDGEGEEGEERRLVRGVRFDVGGEESGSAPWRSQGDTRNGGAVVETEPTEITPLLAQQQRHRDEDSDAEPPENRDRKQDRTKGKQEVGWILLEILLVVPFPVILLSHILVMLIDGMGQSVIDGGPVWVVYALPFALTLLILLPLAPFTYKIHRRVALVCVLAFCGTIIYTWGIWGLVVGRSGTEVEGVAGWGFPFSNEAPLKVYFQQRVEVLSRPSNLSLNGLHPNLDATIYANANVNVRMTTHLTSVPYYLERLVVPALPSVRDSKVRCDGKGERAGLVTCVWDSGEGMWPETGFWGLDGDEDQELGYYNQNEEAQGLENTTGQGNKNETTVVIPRNPWFSGNVTRRSSSVRFVFRGRNSRNCRIYLDDVRAVGYVVRRPGSGEMQGGYEVSEDGVSEVRLWSRTWGKEWVVDVDFGGRVEGEGKIKGRVACEWVEYESATVGVYESEQEENGRGRGRRINGKIPALEEVLTFLPRWATVTKLTDGLVEVWSAFEV